MEFLSRLLSSLIIGLIAVPVFAYIPDNLDLGYHNLSESQKHMIRIGNHAPYNKKFVRRVVVGKARIMPNGAIINIPHGPEFVPSLHDLRYNPKWQKKKVLGNLEFDQGVFTYDTNTQNLINALFWLAHIADVYTTYEGVKYDCIREANPLLPTVPEVDEMLLLKGTVIYGLREAYLLDEEWGEVFWNEWKLLSGVVTGLVAYNNHKITKKAKGRCNLR